MNPEVTGSSSSSILDSDDDDDHTGSEYSSSGSESENDAEEDLIEEHVNQETTCLYCSNVFKKPEECLEHINSVHGIDIVDKFKLFKFDCITFIKFINYVRKVNPLPEDTFMDTSLWQSDDFMKPTMIDDPFLTFDIESFLDSEIMDIAENGAHGDYVDGAMAVDTNSEDLEFKLKESEEKIQQLKHTIEKMRISMKSILNSNSILSNSDTMKLKSNLESSNLDRNQHTKMLSDKIRTESYQKAILGNPNVFKDSTVLDVGCGTGILSMFAASAGAKSVLAVDESDIAFYAMTIVSENNFKSSIEVIKSRLEHLEYKSKKIQSDIIISEWMGYFLVYEGMLDTIIYARENLLKPGGIILPNRCTMNIAGMENVSLYDKHVTFWDNVYGYSMKSLKFECVSEPMVSLVPSESIITDNSIIATFDIMSCTLDDVKSFSSEFSLKSIRNGTIHAIVGWFMTYFDHPKLSSNVTLSTSPFDPATHWKQTTFFLKEPIVVKAGDCLEGRISVTRPKDSDRALRVELSFKGGIVQEYLLM